MTKSTTLDAFLAERKCRRLLHEHLVGALASEVRVTRPVSFPHISPMSWGLYLRPQSDSISESALDSSQEFLLWVCESKDFQVRTVNEALYAISHSDDRLRRDMFVLLTNDSATSLKVRTAHITKRATQPIATSIDHFMTLKGSDFPSFVQQAFFARDLFDVRTPLHGEDSFFGHKQTINNLVDVGLAGGTAACLFGLRKTGKTSMLYQVLDRIERRKQQEHILTSSLDIQAYSLLAQSPAFGDAFFRKIAGDFFDGAAWLRKDQSLIHSLRVVNPRSFDVSLPNNTASMALADDLRAIQKKYTGLKAFIVVDEIELAYEPEAISHTLPALRVLRAMVQEQSLACVSLLVAGTNPRRVFSNTVSARGENGNEDRDNPFYDFFTPFYLSPLPFEAARELLLTLGRRMGMILDQEAAQELYRLTGGYPSLLRHLASHIHRLTVATRPISLTHEHMAARIDDFHRISGETCSQMLAVLRRDYGSSYEILLALATGRLAQFREYMDAFADEAQLCIDYGLFEGPHSERLRAALVQSFIQRGGGGGRRQPKTPRRFEAGDKICQYEIIEPLGEPGGFGEVYRVRVTDSDEVYALKVMHRADVRALNREVEVLSRIQEAGGGHPGLVRMITWGEDPESGAPYLVMEYLHGRPLSYFCNAATCLADDLGRARALLLDVLHALQRLHPDTARVEELRRINKTRDLTAEESDELHVAKVGHIHRDIKPQNVLVVEGRGAVLIDFGITSTAQSSVKTMSHTKGYIPPAWNGMEWAPPFDLYQVGVTFAQAIEGVQIDAAAEDHLAPLEGFHARWKNYGPLGEIVNGLISQDPRFDAASKCIQFLR